MRNSTIIALGIAFLASFPISAAPKSPLSLLNHFKSSKSQISRQKAPDAPMKISELASKLKPSVTKTYGWNGKRWMFDEEISYTYDSSGNIITEKSLDDEGDYVSTIYEYDKNNKMTFKESKISADGIFYQNYKKTAFEYDPILTNVITKRTEWLWLNEDWRLVGNNYKRIITRDENGNITSVVIAVLFNGIYDPTDRIDITYGDDGKAITISEQILDYDGNEYFWVQGQKFTDIKWKDTDGQIYDPELLFLGNNRLLSAHYEDEDDFNAEVSVEYADDSEAYKVVMQMDMDGFVVSASMEYTPLENDGYIAEGITSYQNEVLYTNKEEVRYDDWGHMLLSYESEEEEDEIYFEQTVGTVEYNEQGLPISYTVSEEYSDYPGMLVSEYAFRAEYFDYVDVTANVSDISIDEDAPGVYYNLQGLPVDNPTKGSILIKKQDNKTTKIKF